MGRTADCVGCTDHDQEQTPEHPGGGKPYPVDGDCAEQCDCGDVNPCAEYIFDHRGGEVEGRTFRDWFIVSATYEYLDCLCIWAAVSLT